MKHGDIRWYGFARPDKVRPVLILTRNSAIPYLHEITVAPISTKIRDIPSEVLLTAADGMPRDCAIILDHLQSVSKGKVGSLITTLGSRRMHDVRDALLFAFELGHDSE